MSDENQVDATEEVVDTQPAEFTEAELLEDLKAQAKALNVTHHPSIGYQKLKVKVAEAKAAMDKAVAEREAAKEDPVDTKQLGKKASARDDALKLRRIVVTCMDPSKKEYDGDFFMGGNSKIGTVKKYVPFEVPWHVPQIIYNLIQNKKYQTFVTETDKSTGVKRKVGKLVKAYAIQDLAPLTEKEIKELAQRQAMARGTAE